MHDEEFYTMSIEFFFKLSILSELCLVYSSSKTMIVTVERLSQKVKVSNQTEFTNMHYALPVQFKVSVIGSMFLIRMMLS